MIPVCKNCFVLPICINKSPDKRIFDCNKLLAYIVDNSFNYVQKYEVIYIPRKLIINNNLYMISMRKGWIYTSIYATSELDHRKYVCLFAFDRNHISVRFEDCRVDIRPDKIKDFFILND